MADTIKFVQGQDYFLAGSGCTATATSITLKSFKLPDNETEITMTDFGSIGYGVLEPGTSKEENISFTGITAGAGDLVTLTGVTRGLKFNADYSADSSLRQPHGGGAKFIISNTPQFYDELSSKDNDETVTGIWTFTNTAPPRASASITYGAGAELYFVTYEQLAATSFSGTVDASTSAKGVAEEATQAEVEAGTAAGSAARLFVNPSTLRAKRYHSFAADAGANDSYAITVSPTISAYTDGDVFVFEAATANTGAATLNVNTVGAKTIKKYGNVDLATGDIKAGSVVMVIYDADSDTMMLQTPIARPQISQEGAEIYAVASSGGTDAYAATLTPAITAYTDGMVVRIKVDEPNTGAATLNLNSIGAKTIKKHNDQDLETGDIEDNQSIILIYNSTTDTFQMVSQTAVKPLSAETVKDTAENVRIVRGTVNSDGTVARGSGFTSGKNSTGNYTITITSAFGGTPSATVSAEGGTINVARCSPTSATSITVLINDAASETATDDIFSFIAVGPQ